MPGQPGRFRVIARGVGVVVECVLRALIDIDLVLDGCFHKRSFERRDAGIDPFVETGIVQQHRRFDVGDVFRFGLPAIVGNGGQ